MHLKDFLAMYLELPEFAHILWEATKATFIFTGNKSVTRLFLKKTIPPSLWNACYYVLQLDFKNTAADFLSGMDWKVTEKIHL